MKPDQTNEVNPELIDELWDIRELKRTLEDREKELCQLFRELGEGLYPGNLADVSVSSSNRRTVDLDELRRLYPDIVAELTVTSRVTTVRTVGKKSALAD